MKRILCIAWIIILLPGCKDHSNKQKAFTVLDSKETGIDFVNALTATPDFNMFKYMYFYNGAGVGAGDFNNDGLIDLFFASNQGRNKIYLNTGNMKFKDVTVAANIPDDKGWSTGVSVVDINNDGLLDIYVCRVGQFENLKGKNQLLICTGISKEGIPQYTDKAAEYGVDFSGFSTQAAFFDYDMDGDLDLFLLNHSVHQNGTFAERKNFLGTYHPLSGDRLYRNDGNRFEDVTRSSGINSSAIGYGLGICVADLNMDGYPDIYIGNDFHENDYYYINQKNGTFKEELNEHIMHTSQFSMGVDVADINNDAYPDIISMDMLPADPYILKRSLGEDEYNTFQMKIRYGYNYQYTRNNLQLNRRNGMYSEVGLYSGIAATDWSWAALFADFDNDGLKDLFISNGIPKRLNDIDYVNYVSNEEVQKKINESRVDEKEMAVIDKFPQIKLPNKLYHNKGNAVFEDMDGSVDNDRPTFSNGTIYADLDNDGDLDIVVNNVDDAALIYRNNNEKNKDRSWMQLQLKGPADNINAIGAKLYVFSDSSVNSYEKNPVRGFLSSMEIPLQVGLGKTAVNNMILVWPDNTCQKINWQKDTLIRIEYSKGLPAFDYSIVKDRFKNTLPATEDITAQSGLSYLHIENPFNEFDREPLIPHMTSREGPALAVADINGDGLEDVFIGSSKGNKPAVFLQLSSGKFQQSLQPALDADSTYEEVDAAWVDVNNDKFPDLVIADGGNEYYGRSEYLLPRVFLNDGKGNLTRKMDAFTDLFINASCVQPYDFNNDGYVDLFIGARTIPFQYGAAPASHLLQNDGTGRFTDVTSTYAKGLAEAGMVTSANWVDIDKDGDKDLLVSAEWETISVYLNEKGKFSRRELSDKKGWWNFVLPVDVDNDGDIDLVAGNLGLNSRLKASDAQPVRLYYNDFDDNGTKEQFLTYYLNNKEIPFANKDELQKQLPVLKKKYLYAEELAKASIDEFFGKAKLNSSLVHTANYFSNAIFINDGKMNFTLKAFPWNAQFSSYRDAIVLDVNQDKLPDILLAGNFYENNIEMGRYDADFGTVLINKGHGDFEASLINGLAIKGESRHIRSINMANRKQGFLVARNNDSLRLISFDPATVSGNKDQ